MINLQEEKKKSVLKYRITSKAKSLLVFDELGTKYIIP